MNQDFLNWQEAIHMLPLSDGVCTGKGRGGWRLVDLACPDKNIVWWALLTVFRAWDGHSSTPVRPPWQWLPLLFSFPGPLCRWPAYWRCQHKSGCSPAHNHSLASALVGPLISIKKVFWENLYGCFMFLHYSPGLSRKGLPESMYWWIFLWYWWRNCGVSFELLIYSWPTFDLS